MEELRKKKEKKREKLHENGGKNCGRGKNIRHYKWYLNLQFPDFYHANELLQRIFGKWLTFQWKNNDFNVSNGTRENYFCTNTYNRRYFFFVYLTALVSIFLCVGGYLSDVILLRESPCVSLTLENNNSTQKAEQ